MMFNSALLAVWSYVAVLEDIIFRKGFLIISVAFKQPSDIHENTVPIQVIPVTEGLRGILSTAPSLVRLDFFLA